MRKIYKINLLEEIKGDIKRIFEKISNESIEEIQYHENAIDSKNYDDIERRTILQTTRENVELKLKALLPKTLYKCPSIPSGVENMCWYKISGLSLWDKKGNKVRNNHNIATVEFDYDVSLRNIVIYALAFDYVLSKKTKIRKYIFNKFELCEKESYCIFRGDTMNSYATTVHEYLKLKVPVIDSKYLEFEDKYGSAKWEAFLLDERKWETDLLSKDAKKFIEINHTIGNLIPMPIIKGESLNCARYLKTKDYWDLTLNGIYRWYRFGRDEKYLEEVFAVKDISVVTEWLINYFGEWDDFVEKNYLQSFVKVSQQEENDDYKFGQPKELWKNHFEGIKQGINEYEQFFCNSIKWIEERGELIAKTTKKRTDELIRKGEHIKWIELLVDDE